jgi:hypothetical protein
VYFIRFVFSNKANRFAIRADFFVFDILQTRGFIFRGTFATKTDSQLSLAKQETVGVSLVMTVLSTAD